MIITLLILMTLLIAIYLIAWLCSPSLRRHLERPNHQFMDNCEKFEQARQKLSG